MCAGQLYRGLRLFPSVPDELAMYTIMKLLLQLERRVCLVMLLLTGLLCSSIGCGSSKQDAVLDASAMLERYEKDRRRHDPNHFSEVDLGEYTVSKRREPWIFYVRFHLYGVVPDGLIDEFGKRLADHDKTVRGKVSEVTQGCEVEQLNDPSLGSLKSELISSINRILQAPMLRDVVFGDFAFERN